jgi:hypothetical protein
MGTTEPQGRSSEDRQEEYEVPGLTNSGGVSGRAKRRRGSRQDESPIDTKLAKER